jgi:uncharacterized protein (DUF849 family)
MDVGPPPLIIEVAVNGLATRDSNPHVPVQPDEIARDAMACLRAGASIVHQHDEALSAGRGAEAMAEQAAATYAAVYAEFPDALLYPTIGGTSGPIEDRWRHNLDLHDRGLLSMAFVDPGSVNYVDLDADGLPARSDGRYSYSNLEIRWMIEQCEQRDLAANVMILDAGYLRMATAIARHGRLSRGSFVKLGLGGDSGRTQRGLPATPLALECLLSMMAGVQLNWAVAVMGGDCLGTGLAEAAIRRGGHVRVGLEDYAGPRRPTNAELVTEIVELASKLGRPVATRAEAHGILGVRPRPAAAAGMVRGDR